MNFDNFKRNKHCQLIHPVRINECGVISKSSSQQVVRWPNWRDQPVGPDISIKRLDTLQYCRFSDSVLIDMTKQQHVHQAFLIIIYYHNSYMVLGACLFSKCKKPDQSHPICYGQTLYASKKHTYVWYYLDAQKCY